jgi:hypothetical protein
MFIQTTAVQAHNLSEERKCSASRAQQLSVNLKGSSHNFLTSVVATHTSRKRTLDQQTHVRLNILIWTKSAKIC